MKNAPPAKTVTIRTSLLRTLVLLIVALSATVLTAMFIGARGTIHELSGRLIDQASDQAEEGMTHFFHSMEGLAYTSRAWTDAGLLEYAEEKDLRKLNQFFAPVLTANPQITSMMLMHDEGFEYMLLHDFGGDQPYEWYNRITWTDRGPEAAFAAHWPEDLTAFTRRPFDRAAHYDVRERPYFKLPKVGETLWTDPYYFFTTRDAGMTVTSKWKDPSGKIRAAAFDLLLLELSRFTVDRRPTPNGRVFVMLKDGSLLGLPADRRWPDAATQREALRNPAEQHGQATRADDAAILRTAEEMDLPVIAAAVEKWRAAGSGPLDHFRYVGEGGAWWGGFRRFDLYGPELWIGVIAPENDLLTNVRKQRHLVLWICALALLGAVGIAVALARRYSKPLEALALQTAQVRSLRLTQDVPVHSSLREINQLAEANAQMMAALESFSKYVPLELVRHLLDQGEVAKIGGKTESLTVLFTDIEGFTNLAEGMQPEALMQHMAEYFGAMLEVLHEEDATVDKFIGDAIVAFWGAPAPNADHAAQGVRAVIRCRDLLRRRNEEWAQRGLPPLRTRFGLNTGDVVVGNIGAPNRLNYTVLGDSVNLASRLEALNARYGTEVLVAEPVVRKVGGEILWRLVDRVAVKGKKRAIAISEPLCIMADATAELRELAAGFEQAFARYAAGEFARAEALLDALLEKTPGDGPASMLRERCRAYQANPPGGNWDGVTRFTTK